MTSFLKKSKCLSSLFFCGLVILASCSTSGPAPIQNRAQPPTKGITSHVVEKGDTLFSIAWLYQKDLQRVAAINGIVAPYNIGVGQRLKLVGEPIVTSPPARAASNTAAVNRPISNVSNSNIGIDRTTETRTGTVSRAPTTSTTTASTSVPISPPPKQTTPTVSTSTVISPSVNRPTPQASAQPIATLPTNVTGWAWPVSGNLVRSFGSTTLMKGIVLNGTNDKQVKAAADGVVVYVGSAIRGYGNFIVLKHSDTFLSAYGYNDRLLVNENDQVHKGQQIATAGKDLDGKPRLYFEIRKDGKPVDPIGYLPNR